MATTPSPKNPVTILRDVRSRITTNTNITNYGRTSKTRHLADSMIEESVGLRGATISAFKANQISEAQGNDLLQIGRSMGVDKLDFKNAYVRSTEQNLAFYVSGGGTFGSINGGGDITIPRDTIIYTPPNSNELGERVEYKLTEDITAASADTLVYASARAVFAGAPSNVGRGTLTGYEFSNYTDAANETLRVINFYPVLNGRNVETDSQYRYRLASRYRELHQNSDTRLHLNAIQIPGVLDTKVIGNYFGVGTVGVIVLGADNTSTPSLVTEVQKRLNRYQAPGLRHLAVAASQSLFDLELEVRTARSLLQHEQARLSAQIRRTIINYLRGVGIGGIVRLDEMARAIQVESSGLVRLGSPGRERRLYDKVYVRSGFASGAMSEREEIVNQTVALPAEFFPDLGTLDISWV